MEDHRHDHELSSYDDSTVALYRRRRKVHHKVKTGCKACKVRRQKCDERRPICSACCRYSTNCFYPTETHQRGPPQLEPLTAQVAAPHEPNKVSASVIPKQPPSGLNFDDLELMHQFITSTCMTPSQRPEMTAHVQRTTPQLAQEWPFVMRGILAMSATHLCRLRPSRHRRYAALAAKNHTLALPEFRMALEDVNETNFQAVISFAKTLLWCSMAAGEPPDGLYDEPNAAKNWLPQWFWLLRGSCFVVEASRPWIQEGPHLLQRIDNSIYNCDSPSDDQLTTLASQLSSLTESPICEKVITLLREAFFRAVLQHHNTPARNAINFWIGHLPDEFFALLQNKEPWALVVLAHFCLLVRRSEELWFLEGNATGLMRLIMNRLDDGWREYVRWPCAQLGIDLP